MGSSSLDFLNMIKNTKEVVSAVPDSREEIVADSKLFAVIDTETNWNNEVMSLGVAIADEDSHQCVAKKYYIFEPECLIGGMFSNVLYKGNIKAVKCRRDDALADLSRYLENMGVSKIFAYNARFDHGLLPELDDFEWFDIMRIAAYKQYNHAIPEGALCCKTGRLKSNYGVEPILRMLSGDTRYCETHNAVNDAVDELRIVELLGHELSVYECGRIN